MARINIEDCWWTDPRRAKLAKIVGSEEMADGVAIKAWRVAQGFWVKGKALIPLKIWETIEANSKLIEANLAEIKQDGIYVCGSSQYLDWMRERLENASLGGKKSAAVRKNAPPKKAKNKADIEANTKQTQANASKHQANTRQTQPSDSDSTSNTKNLASPTAEKINIVISRYCDLWKERYNASAPISAKDAGLVKNLVKDFGAAKVIEYIEAYLQMPDAWFVTKRHDIPTLKMNLNAVAQFLETGRIFTKKEIKNLDSAISTKNMLGMIERGEL